MSNACCGEVYDAAGVSYTDSPQKGQLLERAWSAVGAMCAGLVNVLNPEVLVLGGAIANHRPDLHDAVRAEIGRRAFAIPAARVRLTAPHFGDDVSLVGCWALVHDTEARRRR